MLWMFFLLFGSIALAVTITIGYHHEREYRTATPTSATINECHWNDDVVCKGTWNLGGHRYQGNIYGFGNVLPPGTQVNVKTNGLKAYTLTYTEPSYVFAYLLAGFLAVVAALLVVSGRQTRRKNRPTLNP
jgi:hypothetical protein